MSCRSAKPDISPLPSGHCRIFWSQQTSKWLSQNRGECTMLKAAAFWVFANVNWKLQNDLKMNVIWKRGSTKRPLCQSSLCQSEWCFRVKNSHWMTTTFLITTTWCDRTDQEVLFCLGVLLPSGLATTIGLILSCWTAKRDSVVSNCWNCSEDSLCQSQSSNDDITSNATRMTVRTVICGGAGV